MRYALYSRIEAQPGDATARIQRAIDDAAQRGEGTVVLAAGRHEARALRLASRVDLVLEAGALLVACSDYAGLVGNTVSVLAEASDRAFLLACGVSDCGIFGPGTIDGGGPAWSLGFDADIGTLVPAALRPRVLVVEDAQRVTLSGFHITQSPMWTVHLIGSREVVVEQLRIDNDNRLPNTDGIVIDSCSDVSVSDCVIHTADDGICLKTSLRHTTGQPVGPCRRVRVQRCTVSTRSCAFKIGTESHADISDVQFSDCVAEDSNRGLGVISRDGGHIERVRFERIRVDCRETPVGFWGSGEALTLSALDRRASRPAGTIRDVTVTGLTGRAEGALVLCAERPGLISDIRLQHLTLQQQPGPLGTAQWLDLRPTAADVAVPDGAEGRANSWVRLADGSIAGLTRYPGGLPLLYAQGVRGLQLQDGGSQRPQPLPTGWHREALLLIDTELAADPALAVPMPGP